MFNFGLFSNSFSVFLCTMTKRILLFKLFSLEVYFFTEVYHGSTPTIGYGKILFPYPRDTTGSSQRSRLLPVGCPLVQARRSPSGRIAQKTGRAKCPARRFHQKQGLHAFFRIPSAPGFPLQCAALPLPRSQRSSSRNTPQNTGALNSTLLLSPEPGNLYQKV